MLVLFCACAVFVVLCRGGDLEAVTIQYNNTARLSTFRQEEWVESGPMLAILLTMAKVLSCIDEGGKELSNAITH